MEAVASAAVSVPFPNPSSKPTVIPWAMTADLLPLVDAEFVGLETIQ
jgi:hypothetical protein